MLSQQWTFVTVMEPVHAALCERSALGAFQPLGLVAGMPLLLQVIIIRWLTYQMYAGRSALTPH
jgi:hypothetical protein